MTNHLSNAIDLRNAMQRNILIACGVSLMLHILVILLMWGGGADDVAEAAPQPITLTLLRSPSTIPSVAAPASDREGGGGDPTLRIPPGPSRRGSPAAVPDHAPKHNDPKRNIRVDAPDKIRVVKHETVPNPDIASNEHDSTRGNHTVRGTQGDHPDGKGTNPAGGSGGSGAGYGSGNGLEGRPWVVAPRRTLRSPGGAITGTVVLSYTVAPNGAIVSVRPVRRGDPGLTEAAVAALRRCRRRPLPEGAPAITQTGTISIKFTLE